MKLTRGMLYVASAIALLGLMTAGAAFGVAGSSTIGDFVWLDQNENGLQDADEPGVAGVTVELYTRSPFYPWPWLDTPSRTTVTDGTGHYLFSDLWDTDFYVKFILPSGYTWTGANAGDNALDSDADPDTGETAQFTLPLGSDDRTWDAGLVEQDEFTNPGCGTPGYWKTHPNAWPVEVITIGGITYTKAQAITMMKKSTTKDMTTLMFMHLVSAKLNVLIGNSDEVIGPYITAADAWMAQHPYGSKVKADSTAWKIGEPIKNMLDAYNNGLLDAPARD